MNSRDRILTALNHRETDRIPFDLAGTTFTGLIESYSWPDAANKQCFLGLRKKAIQFQKQEKIVFVKGRSLHSGRSSTGKYYGNVSCIKGIWKLLK
jgi:hypothetical protein